MRYMPLRKASITSPSSSIFSSFPSAIHSPRSCSARTSHGSAGRPRPVRGLRERRHVRRLGALVAFARLELDLRAFGQRPEAVTLDLRVMDEQVLAALLGRDEPVALRIAEPLH